MKKNKKIKNLIPAIILLIVLIIIIGVALLFLKKKDKIPKINDTDPNGDIITIIDESNINSQQFIDVDNK